MYIPTKTTKPRNSLQLALGEIKRDCSSDYHSRKYFLWCGSTICFCQKGTFFGLVRPSHLFLRLLSGRPVERALGNKILEYLTEIRINHLFRRKKPNVSQQKAKWPTSFSNVRAWMNRWGPNRSRKMPFIPIEMSKERISWNWRKKDNFFLPLKSMQMLNPWKRSANGQKSKMEVEEEVAEKEVGNKS